MTSKQKLKADARKEAKTHRETDPEIAEEAIQDALSKGKRRPQQPHYVTQNKNVSGENLHHEKDRIVSEFDDPAAHTVR